MTINFIITLLVVTAISIFLALVALEDPGYVVISRAPYEIEISLALLVLLLFLLFVAVYFVVRFVLRTWGAPRDLAHWRQRGKQKRARQSVLAGYAVLIEGNWQAAEQELLRYVEDNDTPLLNYLGAAYAAQQRGDFVQRNQHLSNALALDPEHRVAVQLTRARLEYHAGQLGDARETLEPLALTGPKNPQSQRILAEILRIQGDWTSLESLLPLTRRSKALSDTERDELEKTIALHRLSESGESAARSNVPRKLKKDPAVLEARAIALASSGHVDEAEAALREAMKKNQAPELIHAFAELKSTRPLEQVQTLQKMLASKPGDVAVLRALGKVLHRQGERRKAREYLVEAVELAGTQEDYISLGKLLEELGETENALVCYREGLNKSSDPATGREGDSAGLVNTTVVVPSLPDTAEVKA